MKHIQDIEIPVSPEIGTVSGLLRIPEDAIALLVLAHGAGAGMEHPFMETLALELAARGIGTLRYNFAYMEKGRRAPDRPPKALAVIRAAIDAATEYADGLPLFVVGKSFGGRMSSHLAAQEYLPPVKGLVYFGFPLHASGKPGTVRAVHLKDITLPQLFLQGTRDTLAKVELISEVCTTLPTAKLVFFDGGDHSFKPLKRSGKTHEEVIGALAEEVRGWVGSVYPST